ncbi:MAG: hypothetical protein ACRDBY_00905 [Cetobacterium sp.]
MNPMIMQMLEGYLGKDRAQGLLQQWNTMTPQQQQAEMQKVMGMTKEEQAQYLGQKGININDVANKVSNLPVPQNGNNNGGGRFNY